MEAITTIVYYSSNKEDVTFESKIQANIWTAKGDVPLISITQKPVRFGFNICVGDIGVSESNVWKQMLVGCLFAKTPFVTFCEADTLYPPEYFTYRPDKVDARYWFENVYIFYPKDPIFRYKGRSDCAHMAGRLYMMDLLAEGIETFNKMYNGTPRPTQVDIVTPIVSVKTGNGMRPNTQNSPIPYKELPHWGSAEQLRKDLYGV